MRYKIRTFAGHRHPVAGIKFGTPLKSFEVIGEGGRQHEAGILQHWIESGHLSRVDIFDRNMTLVEQLTL